MAGITPHSMNKNLNMILAKIDSGKGAKYQKVNGDHEGLRKSAEAETRLLRFIYADLPRSRWVTRDVESSITYCGRQWLDSAMMTKFE